MYGTQQFTGQQFRPQQYQYGTIGGYYPRENSFTGIFEMMMPMIMMIMMMAIIMPMMKGITAPAK